MVNGLVAGIESCLTTFKQRNRMNQSKSFTIEAVTGKLTTLCPTISQAEKLVFMAIKYGELVAYTVVSWSENIDYDVLNGVETKAY